MNNMKKELIKQLNEILKSVSTCSEDEIHIQGEKIRLVFFTVMEQNFSVEEIAAVFENVTITDEKIARIEKTDTGLIR